MTTTAADIARLERDLKTAKFKAFFVESFQNDYTNPKSRFMLQMAIKIYNSMIEAQNDIIADAKSEIEACEWAIAFAREKLAAQVASTSHNSDASEASDGETTSDIE